MQKKKKNYTVIKKIMSFIIVFWCFNGWQLANSSMDYNPLYDAKKGFDVMPSSFHDISDVEFQDNWGRVWYELPGLDCFAVLYLMAYLLCTIVHGSDL